MSDATDTPDPDDEMPDYLKPPKAPVVQLPGTQRAQPPKKASPNPKGRPKRKYDLERMELDYRANLLTTVEIGIKHGVTGSRVSQLAKELGWKRDVAEAARARAAAILANPKAEMVPLAELATDVDYVAGQMAVVRAAHRGVIKEGRDLLIGLLREVRESAMGQTMLELYEQAVLEEDPTKKARLLTRAAERVLSLPSRIYGVKKLSDAAKNWIVLERQAYDLDEPKADVPVEPKRDQTLTPAQIFEWASQVPTASRGNVASLQAVASGNVASQKAAK